VTIPTNTNVFLTALALQLITGLAKAYEAAFRVAVSRLASDTKQQLQVALQQSQQLSSSASQKQANASKPAKTLTMNFAAFQK